jgi:hypothetical protein
MTTCHCDYEPARIYRASRPIARKPHRCDECGGQISPGERFESVGALWHDGLSDYRDRHYTCSGCLMIRDHLVATRECYCWSHGGLWEDLPYEFDDLRWKPGERFRALAIVAQAKRERVDG